MTTEELMGRIQNTQAIAKSKVSEKSTMESKGEHYRGEIFLLEAPEGGEYSDIRVVGFTGFPGTLKNEPTKPIRFYAQVIAFEDENAPQRNWQVDTQKVAVPLFANAKLLAKQLDLL